MDAHAAAPRNILTGVSHLWSAGHTWPRMAMNLAKRKIINLLKTFLFCSAVLISVCVFNMWPKTALCLPVWPRDAKRVDTPVNLAHFAILETNFLRLKDVGTSILATCMAHYLTGNLPLTHTHTHTHAQLPGYWMKCSRYTVKGTTKLAVRKEISRNTKERTKN